ncbi:MAG TPA: hypothetical protein VL688_02770 [Verrucomicrobiae bacterium]|jgi:hypothetical protein|nr:hypothetical protein [Verrucomicrobiae bacterium]
MSRTSSECKQCGKLKEKWADEGPGPDDYYCCSGCAEGRTCTCLKNEYGAGPRKEDAPSDFMILN